MMLRRVLQVAALLSLPHAAHAANYYVNDAVTNGDVYCSAAGNSGNTGATAGSPKAALQQILDTYALTNSDVVYVDTGLYAGQTTTFNGTDQGAPGSFLTVQGSTNYGAGGTVFDRQSNLVDVVVVQGSYIRLADLRLRGGRYGLSLASSKVGCEFERIFSSSNTYGFYDEPFTAARFIRCAAVRNTYGYRANTTGSSWDHGVSWSNSIAFQFDFSPSSVTISNSVIVGGTAFAGAAGVPGAGDFNVFWNVTLGGTHQNLSDLQRARNNWWRSTYAEPQIMDPLGLDFHPKSQQGRFDSVSKTWVTDTVTSVVIDLGNPASVYTNEPAPNGSRVDVGVYGNSVEASKSPTNSAYLMALSFNDGGTLLYTSSVYWAYRNFPTNGTVKLDYSPNRGATWINIVTNVLVTNGSFFWNASAITSTPVAYWRVVSETDAGVASTNAALFVIKGTNELIRFYVNDASTLNDVYCGSPGAVTNDGLSPLSPKLNLQDLLNEYDLGGGDTVFVDTGVYNLTNTVTVDAPDQGSASSRITVQGSTNFAAGGSLFDRQTSASDVLVVNGSYVRLVDLRLQGGRYGLSLVQSKVGCEFERIFSISNTYGFYDEPFTAARFIRCAAVRNTYGYRANTTGSKWEQGVSWSNVYAFQFDFDPSSATVSNSVIVGGTAFAGAAGNPGAGDYNVFWSVTMGGTYQNLGDLQRNKNSWWHSTFADPQLGDPVNLDFHPRSELGRFNPVSKLWVTDTVTSVTIDFGNPSWPYTNEPAPNGARIDAGIYGNSTEASRSPTNSAYLFAISYNDGGSLWYTGTLYWVSRNFPTNGKVRIDYSRDRGGSWVNLATNVLVTNGYYYWDASAVTSTPVALWRVVSEANPAIADTNDRVFVVKGTNELIRYYVNDGSTNHDVYCTAVGNSTNDGFFPFSPKAGVQELIDEIDLGPADIVYVDTGFYALTNTVTVGASDQGATNNLMTIQGSTNYNAGGSVFDRQSAASHVVTINAPFVRLVDLRLRGGQYGLNVNAAYGEYEGLYCISNTYGFYDNPSTRSKFVRCAAIRNSVGYRANTSFSQWNFGLSWSNGVAFQLDFNPYPITISNSVIVGGTVFSGSAGQPALGDYNVLYDVSMGLGYLSLNEMQKDKTNWWRSTVADPLFADPASFDFHLKSVRGTYSNGAWVVYTNHSPCIDLGDPAAAYTNEPVPHGSNVNVGIHGNTAEASLSRTNAWLQVLTYSDGGTLNINEKLYWKAGNYPTGSTVRLEFSSDSGVSWATVATGLLASAESYTWANTNFTSTRLGRWRIAYEFNTNIGSATSVGDFTLRNGAYKYYVNDSSTNGDIYTSVVGNDDNAGASAFTPKASVQAILTAYDVEPGDIIYVDTGAYNLNGAYIRITALDCGTNGNPVVIQGSTNVIAGGSVISGNNNAWPVIDIDPVNGTPQEVTIRDLTLQTGLKGVRARNASTIRLEGIATRLSRDAGFEFVNCSTISLSRCVGRDLSYGVSVQGSESIYIDGGVFLDNSNAAIRVVSGRAAVSNSILMASGDAAYLYYEPAITNIVGDYNDLFVEGNALVGYVTSLGRNLDTLSAWVTECGQELHSLSVDPLFADADANDFHLKTETQQGRYDPLRGWLTDSETSLLIDSGDPAAAATNEPTGVRINIGPHGNTWEASKGRTNFWLSAVSHQAGGWTRGTSTLHWVSGNATGGTVRVEVSTDGGHRWSVLTNGVPVTNEIVSWNTTSTNSTVAALWGVVHTSETNVFDRTTNFLSLRNAALSFYVNDDSTSGDTYCAGAGSPTNWVATSNQPINLLATVFSRYDVEPGDRIFVDTGYYTNVLVSMDMGRPDSGISGTVVQVLGSTNLLGGGSVFDRQLTGVRSYALKMDGVQWLAASNLVLRGADRGVFMTNSANIMLSVRTIANASNGFEVLYSSGIRLLRCVAADNARVGVYGEGISDVQILNSVIWSNGIGGVSLNGGTLGVSNSVLAVSGAGSLLFETAQTNDVLVSDYNNVQNLGESWFARKINTVLKYLSSWQESTTNDIHSLSHDPQFADASAGDFHLMSQAGRYQQGLGVVTDTVTSLLIDGGDPAAAFGSEPAPNGNRLNVGLHGNTPEASRSRTNGWLVALTLNSGGIIRGTNYIYWLAGGSATGMLVYVDYSADGGSTWTNIATNVLASTNRVLWNTSSYLSSSIGKWRVVSQSSTSIWDETDSFFALKNEPLGYYVNDLSTNGDVYTTAPGSAANDGLRPSTPKSSIQGILNNYILEQGDRLLIDTGTYNLTNGLTINSLVSGTGTNLLIIQGSTNEAAGGTVLNRMGGLWAIQILGAVGIGLQDLRITNAVGGVYVYESTNCAMDRVRVDHPEIGFEIRKSATNTIQHSVVHMFTATGVSARSSSGTIWDGGAFVTMGTTGVCVDVTEGDIVVSNTIFSANGNNCRFYQVRDGGSLVSDYNALHMTNGAFVGVQTAPPVPLPVLADMVYDSVSRWARDTGRDRRTLSGNPLVADLATGDFHLLSQGGRYVVSNDTFVLDGETSGLVDAGNPSAAFTNEPLPNGRRVNIGPHGNTPVASKTATNGFFTVVSLNDGGRAEGTGYTLYWVAHGDATGHQVRIEFSPNGGSSWQPVVSNLSAAGGTYSWNTTLFTNTVSGMWRITSQSNSSATAASARPFAVRNGPFSFYVNDASTNGDVYTTATGSSSNTGLASSSPKASLQQVLDAYDLEGGDTVYLDTGSYSSTVDVVVGQLDAGDGVTRVVIQGSTNEAAGGTLFSGFGIRGDDTRGVEFRNLRIRPGTEEGIDVGVELNRATNSVVEWVRVEGGNCGFKVFSSQSSLFRHCVGAGARSNGVDSAMGSKYTVWDSGVLWSNLFGIHSVGGSITVSNSVIGAFGADRYAYFVSVGILNSDYNCIFLTNGAYAGIEYARAGSLVDVPIYYDKLARWVRDTERDSHSLCRDPGFANPVAGDFHPLSSAGRYVVSNGVWVFDSRTSPLVDAGDPAAGYGNETSPNGSRVNIGLYANTGEASRTPTNASLTLLSLVDGGRADGTNCAVRWVARGDATGHLVRLDFSADDGATWQAVAANLPATGQVYSWGTTLFTSTVRGVLSIASENDTNVFDRTQKPFAIRNTPMVFYVNDIYTNGDVYAQSAGSLTNLGLTAEQPMLSLQALLAAYDLDDGDVVYVDTGAYTNTAGILVGQLDSANSTTNQPVLIQGSTNYPAGGTLLDRNSAIGSYGFRLSMALGVVIRDFHIQNASVGAEVSWCASVEFDGVDVEGGIKGFDIQDARWGSIFRNCRVRGAGEDGVVVRSGSGIQWINGLLWSNEVNAMNLTAAGITVRNSVFGMFGSSRFVYRLNGASLDSDYNDIFVTNGACVGYRVESPVPTISENVSRWSLDNTQDVHSLSHDPGFYSPTTGDFHLFSQGGRYAVTSGTFVADAWTSALIDAGDPSYACNNETAPNGSRVNIGLFGNTFQASRTPTNAVLTAVSLSDGGRAGGANQLLFWNARGDATGHSVRVEFSPDAGASWLIIATNLPAGTRSYTWNTLSFPSTILGLWRVTSEANTNVFDVTDSLFALRNERLSFYVNDALTNGDVYCSAAGSTTNRGVYSWAPKDSLQAIFDEWDVEPGDAIYVDTGEYVLTGPITLSLFDAGFRRSDSASHVVIQGSTNYGAGGTLMTFPLGGNGLVLDGAPGVEVRNLTIRNATIGLYADESSYCVAEFVRCEFGGTGFSLVESPNFVLRHCLAWGNSERGFSSEGVRGSAVWESGVIWSNRYGAYIDHRDFGEFTMRNSIIGSFGEDSYSYFIVRCSMTSDYNNIYLRDKAFAGAVISGGFFGGGTSRYATVAAWTEGQKQDTHTVSLDPRFVDPVGGDFHLRSASGRYLPGYGWTNDPISESAYIIDCGNPKSVYTNEPVPNGGRINVDMYANTWEASKTPTNGWLVIISLNDGGSVWGTNILLQWFAGWTATGHVLKLEYSGDAGVTWTNIFSNSPPAVTSYRWDSTSYGKSAISKWRITSVDDPSIAATNTGYFSLRNGGMIPYYVNDTSTVGDVYTWAVGNEANDGLFSNTPKASIQGILSAYKLDPRDTIYVDTGRYELQGTVTLDDQDSGSASNYIVFADGSSNVAHVIIQGSTNYADGGTVLVAPSSTRNGISLHQAAGVELRDLTVINAAAGVNLFSTEGCLVERVRTVNNGTGFLVDRSAGARFTHCAAFMNTSNGIGALRSTFDWESGVIWDNPWPVVLGESSQGTFRNSSINAVGYGRRIFFLDKTASIVSNDYNNLVREQSAMVCEQVKPVGGSDLFDSLVSWQNFQGQDLNSLSHDPLFADEAAGDFHPKSELGRWIPGFGYTNDDFHSPQIDTGDPASVYTNEASPNGDRINIGQYGDTPESSLSRTSAWVLAVSFNDRPTISGTNFLRWYYGGMTNDSRVRLEATFNNGVSYTILASNVPMSSSTGYAWDVSDVPLAVDCKWRVISESYPGAEDEVDSTFAIKNRLLTIYVNDSSTNGDIYCTAIGSAGNTGTNAASPLNEPAAALYKYPLGRGDAIYIDTGVYTITSQVGLVLSESMRGETGFPITIYGSTNRLAGGTVINRGDTNGIGLLLDNTRYVEVNHLDIRGARHGVWINNSVNCSLVNVRASDNLRDGFFMTSAQSVMFDRCASWGNRRWGMEIGGQLTDMAWKRGVIWSNLYGGISADEGTLSVSNSIIHALSNTYIYAVGLGVIHANFNCLWKEGQVRPMRDTYRSVDFANLKEWQENKNSDAFSVLIDPLLGNPAAGDFHLKSQAGRYSSGSFVLDPVTSWAIDAGGFSDDFSGEPTPNGSRINLGVEGNTAEASKSLTNNPALYTASLNDGGTVGNWQTLYWFARGMSSTNRLRLDYQANDEAPWQTIATDLIPTQQGYLWHPTNPPSPIARWRVMDQANTNIYDVSDRTFILRVGPIYYFVNDTNTVGDMYTAVPGSPTNSGLTTNEPRISIQSILDDYDLGPSDAVFIDTGVYELTNGISMSTFDGGESTSRVTFVGSTNWVEGGSLLRMAGSSVVPGSVLFHLYMTDGVDFDRLILENADVGLFLERSSRCEGRDLLIRDGGLAGIQVDIANQDVFKRTVITRQAGSGMVINNGSAGLEGCVIWSNQGHAVFMNGANLVVSNSVLHASGSTNVCYNGFTNSLVSADFNALYTENEAAVAILRGGPVDRLAEWTVMTTQDTHSLTYEPLFADPANDDYHLRSRTGRYDPATGLFVTTDTNTSWLIDTGFQNASYSNEPMPNGSRLNIGPHGNTSEASKSRTNAWILAITASGGGRLEGYAYLTWASGLIDSTNRVRLDYSYDNGSNWMLIAMNQSITNGQYLWNSAEKLGGGVEKYPSSPIARWRVMVEADPVMYDVTDSHFALRNKPFFYYVNDTNALSVCDLYTTASGDDNNLGIFSNAPKATLRSLLSTLDVEGGDTILIDAGVYPVTNTEPTVITTSDQGKSGNPVLVRGNTNCTGSVFDRTPYGLPSDVLSVQASYLSLQDMEVRGGNVRIVGQQIGVTNIVVTNGDFAITGRGSVLANSRVHNGTLVFNATNGTVDRVFVAPGSMTIGGLNVLFQNSVVYNPNKSTALRVLAGELLTIRNNTIVSRGTAFSQDGLDSSTTLSNNIIVADGSLGGDAFCIQVNGGQLYSDYNDLVARGGAWIGNSGGNWERLLYWQRASGEDAHSLSHEPLFADEANLDFHLKSRTGRYRNGTWTNDGDHSPAIDAGDPLQSPAAEPAPNGSRVNLGAYGATAQASKSRTNAWVLALTMNDGGVLRGTNMIRWSSGNLGTTDLVRLDYSPDNGSTWTNIASGLSALAHEYEWNTTAFTSSLQALWQVVLQTNVSVSDAVDNTFAVRNSQLSFYVNDSVTNGDVYTSAAGNPANSGLAVSAPKDSIMGILNAYDTESRDVIYVDTGVYGVTSDVRVIWSRGGDDVYGNLLILGSTNAAGGGSLITRTVVPGEGDDGFDVPASHVTLRNFTVQNMYRGVYFESNQFSSAERIFVRSNYFGVVNNATRSITNRNIRLWNNTMGGMDILNARTTIVENCDFVINSNYGFRARASLNNILQNNSFYVRGTNATALAGDAAVFDDMFIDYNLYYFEQTSSIYAAYKDLMSWQLTEGHDFRSAITNPMYANFAAGDFHPQSIGGRYLDGYGWTTDVQSSWGIDKGNPASSFVLEPATNGDRVNIGAFGNTEYASRSSTNVTVYCRVLNVTQFIGEANNIWPLIWTAINVPPSETFKVQYSGDGGTNWVDLATNINSYNEYYIWSTTPYYNTYKGRWRVVGESNTNYWDVSDANFTIFYGTFKITSIDRNADMLARATWRGAWDETYHVQYTTNLLSGESSWVNAPTGGAPNQVPAFRSTHGGDFVYEDVESTNRPLRCYRVVWGDLIYTSPLDVNLYILRSSKARGMYNIVWRCTSPGTFTVQYSTNCSVSWTTAASGAATNQQANFTALSAGDYSFEDVESSSATRRIYRVWYTNGP